MFSFMHSYFGTQCNIAQDCRYRVIESSSLVSVLFREVFSHPYISFFHLLVNIFVLLVYIDGHQQRSLYPLALQKGNKMQRLWKDVELQFLHRHMLNRLPGV